ncbi:MAG: tetratricopeptide repeat protein, partial [Bdellovibrionota bacterium]
MPPNPGRFYKIKLASGRILGPLDLERIRLLILKNQITGEETGREYPQGDWKSINAIPEIADLIVARASGDLHKESTFPERSVNFGTTHVLPVGTIAATVALPAAPPPDSLPATQMSRSVPELQTHSQVAPESAVVVEEEERTMMAPVGPSPEISPKEEFENAEDDRTRVEPIEDSGVLEGLPMEVPEIELGVSIPVRNIATERTVVFQRSSTGGTSGGKSSGSAPRNILKTLAAFAALGLMAWELLGTDESKLPYKFEPIRPRLPAYIQGKSDPSQSSKFYVDGMRYYVADTVQGYRTAADKFRMAAAYDITNVKALAMLASTYLNLIDSSNKDENYFSVLSKLIDMSRAKAVDLPETVIADVEFYITINKAEAAQNRIIEYTKTHQTFGMEMFYYLALAFYARGDAQSAARYLGRYPDNKAFSAKIFYLRGQVAEKLGDNDTALREYIKGIQFNKLHAKSRLRVADLLNHQGRLKEGASHLEFLTNNAGLLAPKDQALAYFLHAQLSELYQKWDLALGDMERATRLDKENHDYLLELYTLRAKVGDSIQSVQKQARMYYFLGEGEKLLKLGRYQE